MNCTECRDTLMACALETADAGPARDAASHADSCAACAVEQCEAERLVEDVAAVVRALRPSLAFPVPARRARLWERVAFAASAACVIAVLGLLLRMPEREALPPPPTARVWTDRVTYASGESITVHYDHIEPGDRVVCTKDDQSMKFVVEKTGASGLFSFSAGEPGTWEVYASQEDRVIARHRFVVEARTPESPPKIYPTDVRVGTNKSAYAPGEEMLVTASALSGDSDWLTLVPVGTPEDTYHDWQWLSRAQEGVLRFAAPAAGEYEARLFFDWPAGGYIVRARCRFTVRP